MRILIMLLLAVILTSCGALLDSMFKDINAGVITYVQQDSCKKILTAKVLDYRMRNQVFPQYLSDLDSIEFNSNQLEIAFQLMWLPDSIKSDTLIEDFDKRWKCDCPNQFDSISLTPYQSDSIDIYTRLIRFKTDSTYAKVSENRRFIFNNDSLKCIKQMVFDFKNYDLDGNEIVIQRRRRYENKLNN